MWPKQVRVHSRSHEVEQTRASRTCLAADRRLSAFALGRVQITRLLHVSLAPSTHPQAHIKAMSDSEAGDDLADGKTSNSASEEDAEVVSTPTPSKHGPKAQTKYVDC